MSFPHVINGRWGFEKDTSTTKQHKLGTLMQIEESYFRYASAGEAVTVGQLMESSAVDANHNDDLAVATTASGSSSVVVTVGGTNAITVNEYADGYLYVNSATTSGGYKYKIKDHLAGAASSAITFNLEDYGGTSETLTNGTDTVGLIRSPYGEVLQSNTTPVGAPVGVTCNDIASGSYGWLQVRGPAICLIQGTPGVGFGLMRSDATAGALEVVAEGSSTLYGTLGHMGCTTGVNNEYHEVNLNIS